MRLRATKYDGNLLTDYKVVLRRPYFINPVTSQWSARGGNTFDFFAGIQSGHAFITIDFSVIGEPWRDKKDILQGWLSDDRETPRELTVVDDDDPDLTEWVIEIVAESGTKKNAREFPVTFSLTRAEWPFWKTVDLIDKTWNVTGTGQTFSFDALGNHSGSKPIIKITPNVSKTNGYANKIWRPLFNPTDAPWHDIPYDLSEDVAGTVAFNTAALINTTSKSNQVNHGGGYNSTALSIVLDTNVGGGLPVGGGMCYNASTGEQIYYTGITANVMTIYDDGAGTTGRGWGGTPAGNLLDNAVLTQSQMMANGYDLRVIDMHGDEIDFWPIGINAVTTRLWINATCEDRIQLTLNQVIANTGGVTSIQVKKNSDNLAALKELPYRYMILIDDEPFIANPIQQTVDILHSVDVVNYKLLGIQRVYAKYGETIASHAKGATINYVPVYYWIVYGNPFAEAQIIDDAKKPMIDMVNSTNLHLIWNSTSGFRDDKSIRTAQVKLNVISTTSKNPVTSRIYTATHVGDADPATVAGILGRAFFKNGRWQIENFQASIDFPVHPAGYSNVAVTANKERNDGTWSKAVAMQKSVDGRANNWITVWNEPTPAGTSYVSFTTLSAALGSNPINTHVRFYVNGVTGAGVGAGSGSENAFEITSANLTVISSRILSGKMRPVMGNYHFGLVFTHVQSTAALVIDTAFAITDTLVIDCIAQKVYRLDDKKPFPLSAGSEFPVLNAETNTFLYEDDGTVDVTVEFDYYGYAWI